MWALGAGGAARAQGRGPLIIAGGLGGDRNSSRETPTAVFGLILPHDTVFFVFLAI